MSFWDQQVPHGSDEDWRGNLSHGFNHLRNCRKDKDTVSHRSIWWLIIHNSNQTLHMYLPQWEMQSSSPLRSCFWPHSYRCLHLQGRLQAAAAYAHLHHGGTCTCSSWTEPQNLCTRTPEAEEGRSPVSRSELTCPRSRFGAASPGWSEVALALKESRRKKG